MKHCITIWLERIDEDLGMHIKLSTTAQPYRSAAARSLDAIATFNL